MCDVFNKDWVGKIKSDAVVNGLLNAPGNVEVTHVSKLIYYNGARFNQPNPLRFKREFETYSDAMIAFPYDALHYKENQLGPARLGHVRLGDPRRKFSFWHYSAPKSIYNLHQPSLR